MDRITTNLIIDVTVVLIIVILTFGIGSKGVVLGVIHISFFSIMS